RRRGVSRGQEVQPPNHLRGTGRWIPRGARGVERPRDAPAPSGRRNPTGHRVNTLFHDIQSLFERTYASAGINFEDCLIDRQRCRQLSALAGPQATDLSLIARTFLRPTDGRLAV